MPVDYIARLSFNSLKRAITQLIIDKDLRKITIVISIHITIYCYILEIINFRGYSHCTARVDRVHTKQQF